jgi:peptidoglycan/xylan/chitin deacetylase (PgdA/CDA1 family)
MVWHTVPSLVQQFFPKRIWNGSPDENRIYLTFDDGPVPGVTEFVLDELAKRNQLATFFVVGDNVRKHPELAKRIYDSGHQVGNHTFHHLNGWKTDLQSYLKNVELCQEILSEKLGLEATIFRPPYGLMTQAQAKLVMKTHQIAMWSLLAGDYDDRLGSEQILEKTIKYSQPGKIVVFHDQERTAKVLPEFLPTYLDYLMDQGWSTSTL